MKKTLAALAVLGAFTGSAVAADVTLYGAVDTGLKYTYSKDDGESSKNTLEMSSGVNTGSQFGLMGTEELGNGVKVGFKLENGFDSDDGSFGDYDGRIFGREASLSVYSDFGTVSLGRMGGIGSAAGTYDIVYAIGDSFDGGDEFAFGFNASDRYDNMITYQTPQVAGLQATVQYSFKTNNKVDNADMVEGRSTADRYAAFALTGEWGPAQVVAAYELQKYSTLNRQDGYKPDDGNTFYLGGNFDFGVAKVFAMGQYFEGANQLFGDSEDIVGEKGTFNLGGNEKGLKGYGLHLGTIVPVASGELTVGAYYAHAKLGAYEDNEGSGDKAKGDYYGFGTRYCYPLSERTTLYVGGGYHEVKGKNYADGNVEKTTQKEGGAYFGIDHHF